MSRPSLSVLAAAVVLAAGLVGVVRGAQPDSTAAGSSTSLGSSSTGSMAGMAGMANMSPDMAIQVTGAYVRQPANRINAAVYFTIYNLSDTPDTLVSATSGAGARTSVHTETAAGMQGSAGLSVPAHGNLALTPGKGHVMIEQLYGPVLAGQTVNLQLTFARAGVVLVVAPVIGVTAPAPSVARTPA
jgi:periplasmic copper chaperone A